MTKFINHPDEPDFEYDYIDYGVYIGTNKCCTTHWDGMLTEENIEADISLEGEKVDQPYGVLFYVWIPVDNHSAPTQEQILFCVSNIVKLIKMKKKIYLHCKNGHGRAPTMMCAYLIKENGMTADEAINFVSSKRTSVHIDDTQVEALREFEKACSL